MYILQICLFVLGKKYQQNLFKILGNPEDINRPHEQEVRSSEEVTSAYKS